ncbi:MAG: acyl carrier protein [Thalassobaculaceae bacterium]|nr:acyl carrier protein [Thalassobaculaceae bacterium]
MGSKEEIFDKIKTILIDRFDIEPGVIALDANLYDDLDIDSIDAVDLMAEIKEISGKKLDPTTFKGVRSVDDVVSAVCTLMNR